jgi:LacI family transcriptional regulator
VLDLLKKIPVLMVNVEMADAECYKVSSDERLSMKMILDQFSRNRPQKHWLAWRNAGDHFNRYKSVEFRQLLIENGLVYHPEWQI